MALAGGLVDGGAKREHAVVQVRRQHGDLVPSAFREAETSHSLKRRASNDDKVKRKEIAAISFDCVSPELVLVDPELARRERARLVEAAKLDAWADRQPVFDAAALRRAVERAGGTAEDAPTRKPRWRPTRRWQVVLAGCFFVGMFVNGAVLASIVTRPHKVSAPTPRTAVPVSLPRNAQLERRVLLALARAPSRLPTALLDPTTGLPRTNMRVACHYVGEAQYRCRVGAPGTAVRLRLQVRFAPGASGVQFVKEVLRRPV